MALQPIATNNQPITQLGEAARPKRWLAVLDLGDQLRGLRFLQKRLATLTLNFNDGTSASIFNDLGSGTSYGSFVVSSVGSYSDILNFTLNGAALADLNAAIAHGDQFFSVGGTLTPSATPDGGSSLALLGLGAAALSALGRKNRRA